MSMPKFIIFNSIKVLVTCFILSQFAIFAVNSEDAQPNRTENANAVETKCHTNSLKFSDIKGNDINTTTRLDNLRREMCKRRLDAYIIMMDDENQSEYVADEDKRIKYISGFSGSAGTVIVTLDRAGLWTDGRYSLQAKRQLDSDWFLVVTSENSQVLTVDQWLSNNLKENDTVGSDPRNMRNAVWTSWSKTLKKKKIDFVEILPNLIDESWNKLGRPFLEHSPVFILNESFSGKSWQNKIFQVRQAMRYEFVDVLVVNQLVNVAWLFNLRGHDVLNTPVFKSYALVGMNFTRLYVRDSIIGPDVRNYLDVDNCTYECVEIKNYIDIAKDLNELGQMEHIKTVWLSGSASRYLFSTLPESKIFPEVNPIEMMQAVKNPTEIKGMKNAQLRDSVALVEFLAMLEEEVKNGKQWDEMKAANSLIEFRRKEKFFVSESFPAISASGANGAVIHYRSSPETNRPITTKDMYLLDSGAQYLDGTTDVTRTLHFGEPTDFQKDCYTAVLLGAIRMAKTVFAAYTKDRDFDIIARSALTDIGLDYKHGTGHGIGSFLSVHEGPFSVSPRKRPSGLVTMLPGMFLSDEPGFYYEGDDGFGIRLETIVTIVQAKTKYNYHNLTYLTFEPVTLVPFERNLIDIELFTKSELDWLNNYHARVEKEVGSELLNRNETRAYNWLIRRTVPLHVAERSKTCDVDHV